MQRFLSVTYKRSKNIRACVQWNRNTSSTSVNWWDALSLSSSATSFFTCTQLIYDKVYIYQMFYKLQQNYKQEWHVNLKAMVFLQTDDISTISVSYAQWW